MSDYEAVYNAIRSKVNWPDVDTILRNAFDISWPLEAIKTEFINAAFELQRPCVIFKPTLGREGDHWCALFGENLHDGVAGFGKTPAEAMYAFDKAWREMPAQPSKGQESA